MIKENIGFVANDNMITEEKHTVLEYGQYALVFESSQSVLERLKGCFNPLDAVRIYLLALVYVVDGFRRIDDIPELFSQSYLSVRYPSVQMGRHVLTQLLDGLGRNDTRPTEFQRLLLDEAGQMAIDGHDVESFSHENDLAEYGNKYSTTGDMQVNLLMAYDLESGTPVLSHFFPGGVLDKTSVKEIFNRYSPKDKFFIVDRGFYSKENLKLFSDDGNQYIIPLSENLLEYKAMEEKGLDYRNSFVYRGGKRMAPIYFIEDRTLAKGANIILYKDMGRAAEEESAFRDRMSEGRKGYTEEKLEALKPMFGTVVLRTSLTERSAEQIFVLYKNRWKIETYYDMVKNRDGFAAYGLSGYYKLQGLAFIILVAGLVERSFRRLSESAFVDTTPDKILLEARYVKIKKGKTSWEAANYSKKLTEIFKVFSCPLVGDLGLPT
jgi:hypothetical protein